MMNLTEVKEKSGKNDLNGRDFLRGFKYALAAGLVVALTKIGDVRQFAVIDTYIDILNVMWPSIVGYLLVKFPSTGEAK
jgi:hypothetical protein